MLVNKTNKIVDNNTGKHSSSVKPMIAPVAQSRKMMQHVESDSSDGEIEVDNKLSQGDQQTMNKIGGKLIDEIQAQISKSIGFENKANRSFRSYDQIFRNLLKYEYVDT